MHRHLNNNVYIYKGSSLTTSFESKMGTAAPVAIGTRGTIGSLLRREIEFFKNIELENQSWACDRPEKRSLSIMSHVDHGNGQSRASSLGSLFTMSWRGKKRRRSGNSSVSSGGFLSSLCSAVDVTDSHCGIHQIPGFRYRSLREALEEGM
ncbi:hypothetical protein Droror1_Dr00010561 [Drosera rotundifolia]